MDCIVKTDVNEKGCEDLDWFKLARVGAHADTVVRLRLHEG